MVSSVESNRLKKRRISEYTLHILNAKYVTQLADELGQRADSGWKKIAEIPIQHTM